MQAKLKAFEYFVFKLTQWYKEAFGDQSFDNNDLSKLKIFKLHFFTTAISASPNADGLLEIFNDFYAMPFGPVESTIYRDLANLKYFDITNSKLVLKAQIDDTDISNTIYKDSIDSAIAHLKNSYFDLIRMTAFDLVELSHKWSCWSIVFDYAKSHQKMSSKIPKELIRMESQKVFSNHHNSYVF